MFDRNLRDATDERLLASVARGEEAALRELHRRHARAAVRFAWRVLGDVADAEEAVADAFCDIWRKAHRFNGASRVRTWLLGIVRHKALDLLRRRRGGPMASLDEEGERLQDDEAVPVRPWDVAPTSIQLALARGHRWLAMLESGEAKFLKEIATREGIDNSYVSRMVNLTTLAPDIVAAILDDVLPNHITLFDLAVDPPALWEGQRARVGLIPESGHYRAVWSDSLRRRR